MKLYLGDCLEVMKEIPDGSVDMVLADLPYGTTACKWDIIIPFDKLWAEYRRVTKDNAAIVLFSSQPFTSALVMSNPKEFKYEWIWEKAVGSNFVALKYQPMKEHENILVFSKRTHKYYPIKEPRKGSGAARSKYGGSVTGGEAEVSGVARTQAGKFYDPDFRNPSSVQYFNNREIERGLHPTQKPIALCEYLIKTYTQEGETVLDNTMGSGSTGVACLNTRREFIGCEKEQRYFDIAKDRCLQKELALAKNAADISRDSISREGK